MTNKDQILKFLKEHNEFYCDDCLANLCKIRQRQTVFSICSKLAENHQIVRRKGMCSYCNRRIDKNISSFNEEKEEIQTQSQTSVSKPTIKTNILQEYNAHKTGNRLLH